MTRARRLTLIGAIFALAGSLVAGSLVAATPTVAQDASPHAAACTQDVEPNDTPEAAPAIATPGCITGTLPEQDQDLFLWTVSAAAAQRPWDITLEGIDGTVTGVKILAVVSDPDITPLTIGNLVLEVDQAVDETGPASADGLLLPAGTYLVGISRSSRPDNTIPDDTAYRVTVSEGAPLAPSGDVEPNDDATTATPLADSFSISGDAQDSQDYYLWTTSELDAGRAWQLELTVPLATGLQLYLDRADGSVLASVAPTPLGLDRLSDLVLPAGQYLLVVYPSTSAPSAYALSATLTDLGAADPEPNGAVTAAIPIDPAHPVVRGRIATGDGQDWYTLVVDDTLAGSLLDIRLIWRDGPVRQLCLTDATGIQLQCRTGDNGAALTGLRLPPGVATLKVSGDASDSASYLLRVDTTTAPSADFETEPNDDPARASAVEGTTMRGQLGDSDRDTFRVSTTGAPQLWQVDVAGTGISRLRWERPDGAELGTGDLAAGGVGAQITDMYLTPGDHWLEVQGSNGDYTLTLTPLGPPDPNGEREPNNQVLDAEPFNVGDTRTGRLPNLSDTDIFRLTVETADHLRITVTPPSDSAIDVRLESGSLRAGDLKGALGVATVYDAQLQPGDYDLRLQPATPSLGKYSVTVEREDPFLLAVDQEPNDGISQARPLPASLHVDGDAPSGGGDDWFVLGSLPSGGDLAFQTSGGVTRVVVSDGVTDHEGTLAEDGSITLPGLPAGVPLWLRIVAIAPYTVDIDPGATGLPHAVPEPVAPEVTVTLTADHDAVAAYWAAGQQVSGTLTLVSTGAATQDLALDPATSDPDWSVDLDLDRVQVEPGATIEVPVTIRVLPDAAIDGAVRLTIRARTGAGGQATGWTAVASRADAPPIAPYQAWPVPDALLGGLNLASAAVGGTPVVSTDPAAEAQLYDGVTPSGRGFQGSMAGTPLALTVDLAGDAALPVAGMALDPLGTRVSIDPGPRAFALLLSDDGSTWMEAFQGELSPLTTDQYFVLPEPVPARFAQLRIDSTWAGTTGPVVIGEWKVIAVPGSVPDTMPSNIADPVRGGHVVWLDPQASSQDYADSLLTEDPADYALTIGAEVGTRQAMVIGFADDRQAQLTGMEWVDPVPSMPDQRLRSVDVAVSTTSPVGPWKTVGTWDLERADDGTVAPFAFDAATWARFVQLTGTPLKKGQYAIEQPATVRILEATTTESYRSILGEWGLASSLGPREWSQPPDLAVDADAQDGDDTPETARTLVPGTTSAGRVHRDQDVDWYRIAIPDGQNSIAINIGGVPAVGVSLTLVDQDGQAVPMTFGEGEDGTVLYTANVTPGGGYTLQVAQPPFSAVFAFDTSGSMGNYLPFVSQALRAYTSGVTKGDEAVKVQPFEEKPLLPDWSDDPYLLRDAVNRYVVTGGSSSAETALIDGSKELAGREGSRAVLMVTDAETSSYQRSQELWAQLASVRPTVFAVHVGGDGEPMQSRRFMQDWSIAGGGFYQYAVSHGEMDQAFARMATWLRRPAAYTLDAATSVEAIPPPPPGALSVTAAVVGGAPTRAPASKDVAVAIILDTSGSMLDRFGGESRINIAKQVLGDLVTNELPVGAPIAVRVLGNKGDPCGTRLAVPFGPLDPDAVTALVDKLKVDQAADTPIGAALEAVPTDLADASGTKIVLLITDSKEIWPNRDLCGKDPEDVIRQLVSQGVDARINIVGLAVDDKQARKQMTRWAKLGGGAYFDARNPKQLGDAIRAAVSAPFEVFDATGESVATGTVGGPAVKVPPGTYRVVVLSDPEISFEGIVVTSEGSVTLSLPSDEVPVSQEPGASPGPGGVPGTDGSPLPGASAAP